MYREKQLSQLAFFEELQKRCTINDVSEAIEIGMNILRLAKEIDKLDERTEITVSTNIDGEELHRAVKQLNDEYRRNHTCSPKDVMSDALKNVLKKES